MAERNSPATPLTAWDVLQALSDGAFVADSRGTIVAVNDAFRAVTGYSRTEVAARGPFVLLAGGRDRALYARMRSSLLRTGGWRGEVWNRRKSGEPYLQWLTITAIKDGRGRARGYLGVSRDITSPRLEQERLKRLAQHDPLTGLPNRRLFHERLAGALARRPPGVGLAALFLDLDRFKEVNDRWGHAAGDAFLRAVSSRLRGCVRRSDVVARLAGDEFAVLLDPVAGRAAAARVARKILRVMRETFVLRGRRIAASASIGGCMLEGEESPASLLEKADRAMYAVKRRGRDDFRFWPARRRPLLAGPLRRRRRRTRRPP